MRKGAGWRREHRQPPAEGEKFLLTSLFIGRPSRTCVVTFARIGYAIRPTTGNWRNEDFHLPRFAALSAASNLSIPPARGTPGSLPSFRQDKEFLRLPVDSILTKVTCPLRSTGITPLFRYYEAVRP